MKQLILFVALIFFTGNLFAQDEFTLVKLGQKAPDFTFETAPGKTAKLSDFKGKVVWINFFATWCGPCRQELPHLQKEVYDKLKNDKNFQLIILGREHSWEEINKFKSEQKLDMPFSPDTGRVIFSKYAKQNIPRNFIIDKEGNIAVTSSGFSESEFAGIIEKMKDLLK